MHAVSVRYREQLVTGASWGHPPGEEGSSRKAGE